MRPLILPPSPLKNNTYCHPIHNSNFMALVLEIFPRRFLGKGVGKIGDGLVFSVQQWR
jgi:hypothetical protein